ncbi:MAG: tetratricopeptide repeat protein [Geobacter sp.]|nr:tetratricopeptide repeat protein [Geobacter sp.]
MKITCMVMMATLAVFTAIPVYAETDFCYESLQQKQYDEAIRECTRQINGEIRMQHPEYSYNNRGTAYRDKGQLDPAIADYTRAIELDPKYAHAYNNRGNAYNDKGQLDPAIADYTRAIELDPKFVTAYNNRGCAYYGRGQYDQAIADHTRAIELDPKYALAHFNRGNAYREKGQLDQAIADYTREIELDPKNEYGYIHFLIATWLAKGNATVPLDRLRQHVTANSSAEWVRTISRYYLGVDKMTEESVLAEARKGKDGKEVNERLCEAYYYLGVKRLVAGKRKGATDYFTKSIETGVKDFVEYQSAKALLELMGKKKK